MSSSPVLLFSPLLHSHNIPHAFTTRVGGVSAGPFDSLNFGNPMDLPPSQPRDPVENIRANFKRVQHETGLASREVVEVFQIHSALARTFRAGDPSRERRPALPHEAPGEIFDFKADAIVTDDAARALAVRVADCCPILLASGDGKVVAAVHAGWRGVVGNIITVAVKAMRELGDRRGTPIPPDIILAAIGPCIGPEQFEVGPEVLAEFRAAFGDAAPILPHTTREGLAAGKGFVDVKRALQLQLSTLGVGAVDVIEGCTASDARYFFSHRRDKGVTGRMIGIIGPAA